MTFAYVPQLDCSFLCLTKAMKETIETLEATATVRQADEIVIFEAGLWLTNFIRTHIKATNYLILRTVMYTCVKRTTHAHLPISGDKTSTPANGSTRSRAVARRVVFIRASARRSPSVWRNSRLPVCHAVSRASWRHRCQGTAVILRQSPLGEI